MGLFCAEADLANESDVEQKVILPLLRQEPPLGFGFQPAEIKSKPDIRRFEIDKGESKKLYYPDYVIVIGGLPVLIVEAKGPGEDVATARREARLYAGELNAIFPAFKNPCRFTLVSNGKTTSVQAWDSDAPLASFALDEADPANLNFGKVFEVLQAKSLREFSYEQLSRMFQKRFFRPLNMVGGQSVRNEEIAPNTFGTALVFKFRHLFNPVTREDRAFIVRNAYIPSQRRERYIQQIDKIIRAAASPSVSDAKLIEDTGKPVEVLRQFESLKQLEHQVLLLIGAVGAGKSTFVDYVKEIAVPDAVKRHWQVLAKITDSDKRKTAKSPFIRKNLPILQLKDVGAPALSV